MPELYEEFLVGNFTVKPSSTPFSSVGTDQVLEQTINRAGKQPGSGVIGSTKNKEYVTGWNLTYHEISQIKNALCEITHVTTVNDDIIKHHDSSPTMTRNTEEQVSKIMTYIAAHCNPFKSGKEPLRNIVTQELLTSEYTDALLNIFKNGCDLYKNFFRERFVEISKSLSDPIAKVKLPTFMSTRENSTVSEKRVSIA